MADEHVSPFTSPVIKLARFFEKSRNGWKTKYRELKRTCKVLQNQTRAVERSRELWRDRAVASDQRVVELEREIKQLKFGL